MEANRLIKLSEVKRPRNRTVSIFLIALSRRGGLSGNLGIDGRCSPLRKKRLKEKSEIEKEEKEEKEGTADRYARRKQRRAAFAFVMHRHVGKHSSIDLDSIFSPVVVSNVI